MIIQMMKKTEKEEEEAWAAWRSPCLEWRAPSSSVPSSPSSPSAPSSTKGRAPFWSLFLFPSIFEDTINYCRHQFVKPCFPSRGVLKAYPAPLAIPLPSYQMGMDSSGGHGLKPAVLSGSVGPPLSILHHGDPRRQSTKSHHSSTQVPSVRHSLHHHHGGGHHHHHGPPPPPPPPPHQFESSEDTSDTCLDDHGAGDAR